MLNSLDRLAALPDDTAVYCAHEYTASNARFALHADPDNAALRARNFGAYYWNNPFEREARAAEGRDKTLP